MSEARTPVLVQGSSLDEDALRLPREPGVIRRFWSRHPLFADILLAVFALLLAVPAVAVRAPTPEPLSGWTIALAIALEVGGCAALVWRRRWPVAVFAVSLVPALILDPALAATLSGPVSLIALYSIAVYRSVRACWTAFGVACGVVALHTATRILLEPTNASVHLNIDISTMAILLIGALVGVNVGNRRRYTVALIDRSRQLMIERDQQAQLAAAAERTRIAREMHDIVSHSLTVIVALSEGAAATGDIARAREANRGVAATARDALGEMRAMLGVLRTHDDEDTTPLGPLLDGTSLSQSLLAVVEAARASGYPATLSVSGVPTRAASYDLAARRVVQEGITNAMRYSKDPTYIRAVTEYSDSGLTISIENDGSSMAGPSVGSGWGLRGLRERVDILGGTLAAGPIAPDAWKLVVTLPPEAPRG